MYVKQGLKYCFEQGYWSPTKRIIFQCCADTWCSWVRRGNSIYLDLMSLLVKEKKKTSKFVLVSPHIALLELEKLCKSKNCHVLASPWLLDQEEASLIKKYGWVSISLVFIYCGRSPCGKEYDYWDSSCIRLLQMNWLFMEIGFRCEGWSRSLSCSDWSGRDVLFVLTCKNDLLNFDMKFIIIL